MKKLICMLVFLHFVMPARAQWCEQEFGAPGPVHGVVFLDSLMGWAHGLNYLKYTDNGGEVWLWMDAPPFVNIFGMQFTTPMNGWIVGQDYNQTGFIYATADGGNSWNQVPLGMPLISSINDLFFLDSLRGWAVGVYTGGMTIEQDTTYIFRTRDGGTSWEKLTWDYHYFTVIFFSDSLNGWIGGAQQQIFHTSDGGVFWEMQETPDLQYDYEVNDIFFTDPAHGWATGEFNPAGGLILKYSATDGWGLIYYVADSSYSSVYFADTLEGWVTAEGILHTVDGGYTWEEEECFPPSQFLNAIFFPDPGHGWAGGVPGTIYKTCMGTGVPEPVRSEPALYPNPARNFITVEFSSEQPGKFNFLLFDCAGRLVLKFSEFIHPGKNIIQIHTNTLKNGMHYYWLHVNEHQSSGKLSILN